MHRHTSCRPHLVALVVACAIGFPLGSCSTSTPDPISVSYSCASPPADLAGCGVDSDCTTVAIGCYCGAQPVNGVARKYATTAQSCETTAASSCALGCATQPKQVTQDGTLVGLDTVLGAHCDRSGATSVCKSYIPPAGGGSSGAPGSGGW
jgi:hypothetical protein